MAKLLMITGLGSASDLASGKKGAFYNTLEEFHKYWDRIDIIAPKVKSRGSRVTNLFGNVHIHISPWPLMLHPIWFIKKGLELHREQKFNLMTVQEFPPFYNGIGARLLWQKIRVPYVLEIHHIPGYPKTANLKEKIYKNLVRGFIRFDSTKAKAIRVVNQTQVPEFLIKAGIPQDKILYIPSIYIDLETFKPTNLEKEYDMIFVGRLEPNKGIGIFIDAAKKLDAKAIIVGDGPLVGSVRSRTGHSGTKIDVHGWARDSREVAELINRSKILVMPSYNEGGPRVVLEAMACGVPVLATPVGIVTDIIKDGESGVRIGWDSKDIAEKSEKLLNDPVQYEKYSRAGIELAKQFEKKEVIKNYADKLKGLV
ncbi:MAG: glycosyltransferase family 4 protein [Candidatus Colwellbacteria bacterium]